MELKIFYALCGLLVVSFVLRWRIKKVVGKKIKILKKIQEWVNTFLIAGGAALFIMYFFIQAFKIPSGSMMNTLQPGDHIFVCKFMYGTRVPFTDILIWPVREPERKEIIVFRYPLDRKTDFIKRCIGLPGETIQIINKKVYINGELLEEPYVVHYDPQIIPGEISPRDNYGPVKIDQDCYFVMGDNRDASLDSRFWGFLNKNDLKGKPLFIYWPPNRWRVIK